MPAVSKAQQHLASAAMHGATFAKAKSFRRGMTLKQLSDFASGSMKGKPQHVKRAK